MNDLRSLFSNARKLYVQGKFRQLLDLTSGVDTLTGNLRDNTLASGLRKLRWQAVARANLEREEADKILGRTVQQPKDLAPDEVVYLLPALSPDQRRKVIKGFLAAQSPAFFDRVADRQEPECQLYDSLVEAYVLTPAPDASKDDTAEFLQVSLVGQDKKQLLRQLTLKGAPPLPTKETKVETIAVAADEASEQLQGVKSTTTSAPGSRVTSTSSARLTRQAVLATNKNRAANDVSSRDRNVGIAVATSVGVLALLSVILRKQLAKILVIILAALQRTIGMAMTRS